MENLETDLIFGLEGYGFYNSIEEENIPWELYKSSIPVTKLVEHIIECYEKGISFYENS